MLPAAAAQKVYLKYGLASTRTRPAALKSLSQAALAGNGVFNLINVDFRDDQTSKDASACVGGIMYGVVCNDVLHIDMWPTPGTKEGILVIIALTWRKLRPELTRRKRLRAHFYFGNDMVASKVTK